MKGFYINNRFVLEDTNPLVIAEVGINHGGSIKIAKEMVDSAYRAGAEIIKHQTHIIDDEMRHNGKKCVAKIRSIWYNKAKYSLFFIYVK